MRQDPCVLTRNRLRCVQTSHGVEQVRREQDTVRRATRVASPWLAGALQSKPLTAGGDQGDTEVSHWILRTLTRMCTLR